MSEISMVDFATGLLQPTVDNAIRWYQEEAWRKGVLGYDRDIGDLQDIFQDWNVESPPLPYVSATAGNAMDLVTAALRQGGSAATADNTHWRRMRLLDADFILQGEVRLEVNRRLLEAGMHPQEINANTEGTRSLTLMTAYLWDIEHRAPNFDFKMNALVLTNFRGTKLPTPIVLSTKEPFPELLASLKEFVVARAEMTGKPIAAGEDIEFLDAWRYRMVECKNGNLRKIDGRFSQLAYDTQYQILLRRFGGPGQGSAIPLFVPVNVPRNETLATLGVVNGAQLEAQQGPSGVAANSAEISGTETVGREESLERVNWADLAQRYMEGQDFELFGDC